MYVVMGATGHVGSACVTALRRDGRPVLAVVRDRARAKPLEAMGAEIAVVAEVTDVEALRETLRRGRRAFLLNPPAAPSTDTDRRERAGVEAILAALEGSGLEKVVVESTMGAQAGERLGDLSVLWALEEGVRRQPIPAAVNRGAYYLSNFDLQLAEIRTTGRLHTPFPADFELPMAAPQDLGEFAARRLVSSLDDVDVVEIEGPTRPTFGAVAQAFGAALGRSVEVATTPRHALVAAFEAQGFSAEAAEAYARMTAITLEGIGPTRSETEKGEVAMETYVRALVAGQAEVGRGAG